MLLVRSFSFLKKNYSYLKISITEIYSFVTVFPDPVLQIQPLQFGLHSFFIPVYILTLLLVFAFIYSWGHVADLPLAPCLCPLPSQPCVSVQVAGAPLCDLVADLRRESLRV